MAKTKREEQDLFPDAPLWWQGLTDRRKLFVELYCTDRTCFLNATAAYIKAFGRETKKLSEASIQSNASRMLREPKVNIAIGKLMRSLQNEKDKMSEFQVLDALNTLSFYNPADIIDKDGNLVKSLEELGPLAMCITGIKKNRNGYEIKLYDRTKSLAMLGHYLNLIRPVEGNTIVNPVVYINDKEDEAALKTPSKRKQKAITASSEEAEYELMGAAV
ncbi:MAG: terminase small subunit [Treponema sp.]|jgi:hypothetical protein|nr:terminase small subunit [Treponema sp.]